MTDRSDPRPVQAAFAGIVPTRSVPTDSYARGPAMVESREEDAQTRLGGQDSD